MLIFYIFFQLLNKNKRNIMLIFCRFFQLLIKKNIMLMFGRFSQLLKKKKKYNINTWQISIQSFHLLLPVYLFGCKSFSIAFQGKKSKTRKISFLINFMCDKIKIKFFCVQLLILTLFSVFQVHTNLHALPFII